MTVNQLDILIRMIPYTHVYWCPVGGHWGATAMNVGTCPMECNLWTAPYTEYHRPEEAQ